MNHTTPSSSFTATSSPKASKSSLEQEHRLLSTQLNNLRRQEQSSSVEHDRLSLEQANWQNSLQDTKRKLDTVLQDLQASGALATGENSLSFIDLSESFEGVNELIETIALRIQHDCEGVSIGQPNVAAFATKSASSFPEITRFLDASTSPSKYANGDASGAGSSAHPNANDNADAAVFVKPLVRSILCHRLLEHIFEPFSPGIDFKQEAVLTEIERSILSVEGLERAVRWRALTYPYTSISSSEEESRYKEYLEGVAYQIFEDLVSLEQELVQTDTLRLDEKLFSAILDVVTLSEMFQCGAMSRCIQGDAKVFKIEPLDPHQSKKVQVVENISSNIPSVATNPTDKTTSNRLLTVGLGLQTRWAKSTTVSGKLHSSIQINWEPRAAVCTS